MCVYVCVCGLWYSLYSVISIGDVMDTSPFAALTELVVKEEWWKTERESKLDGALSNDQSIEEQEGGTEQYFTCLSGMLASVDGHIL